MTTILTGAAEQAGATGFAERYRLDPAITTEPYGYLNSLPDHAPVYWSRMHRARQVTGRAPLPAANPHLGFGRRFRIGAALAGMVAGSALDVLVHDCPRLAPAGHDHDWQPSLLNRSLTALPVRY